MFCCYLIHKMNRLTSDMSRIVMDYLIAGGYTEAAAAYANEVGLKAPDSSLVAAMDGRRRIIAAVEQGDIPGAIAQVVENYPEVRDTRGRDDHFSCTTLNSCGYTPPFLSRALTRFWTHARRSHFA